MIIDKIDNAFLYFPIHKKMHLAFSFLSGNNLSALENGKYEIDGGSVYALVSSYETKPALNSRPETHKKYTDIHYAVSGSENIGYAPYNFSNPAGEYDEEKDFVLHNAPVSYIKTEPGMFALFFPGELHTPGIMNGGKETVKKIVIKILHNSGKK
ncbi:MAG: YhcH/YjgK/YiaL family protein [Bacteroidetes bacterium]|nr:YhcH/YjgK/YiaL family protein [Bacteroidota bacterium]